MYPTRYIDNGKVLLAEEVTLNSLLINGMALAGREEPMLLLITMIMPIITIEIFLAYLTESNSALSYRQDYCTHTIDQL